jgi:TPR repeat protein
MLGYEVKREKETAIAYLQEAAKSGIPYAIYVLFYKYNIGTKEEADK